MRQIKFISEYIKHGCWTVAGKLCVVESLQEKCLSPSFWNIQPLER